MEPFRNRLQREVPRWVGEGIVSREQAERILSLYPYRLEHEEPGWAANLLHAAAGILIGAAALALVFVGLKPEEPSPILLALGALLGVAGWAIVRFSLDRGMIGDALLVASLVPLVPAAIDTGTEWAGFVTAGVAIGYILWRYERVFVQVAGVIAFSVATPIALNGYVDTDMSADMIWLLAQVGLIAGLIAADQLLRQEEGIVPVALAVVALTVASIITFEETVGTSEAMEVLIGIGAAGLIAIGVKAGHRGLVTGAVLVLSADAIAFGFDAGNVVTGILVLLAVAAVLLWQGDRVREYFSE